MEEPFLIRLEVEGHTSAAQDRAEGVQPHQVVVEDDPKRFLDEEVVVDWPEADRDAFPYAHTHRSTAMLRVTEMSSGRAP